MLILVLRFISRRVSLLLPLLAVLSVGPAASAQENLSARGKELYDQIKAAALTGGTAEVKGLALKRDRAEMTFDGTFYFTSPIQDRVTGAVFIGQGTFRAEVPPSKFEQENVRRLLGTDVIESDFKTAVLRFSDDTFERIGANRQAGAAPNDRAQKLMAEADARMLKETGANLPARLALSLLNAERPGFFCANFAGGKRDNFSFLLDQQNRIPVANFALDGGEKGLIFAYQGPLYGNDIWMAFYALEDYQRRTVEYSDVHDLIDITDYKLDVDLREPADQLKLGAHLALQVRQPELRAVAFQIGESLGEFDNRRLKKQLRLKAARLGGVALAAVQEDWEGGLTVFLPRAAQVGEKLELDLDLAGDFIMDPDIIPDCYYPVSTTDWYPRQGYLDRATFELSFHHRKRYRVAAIGQRLSEEPDPENKDFLITRYRMPQPVPLATFALGPFERHTQMVKWDKGGEPIPVEFNSLPGAYLAIKEDFILAELDNSLRYFSLLFGKYPYPVFGATFHPFAYGQGFPSMLMLPATDRANKYTYSFIAHETAHQWWGDMVAWRSYRDQWLSEGFAEYSGALYTGLRASTGDRASLISDMRRSLRDPPVTRTGLGKGRLNDVGPIILGHRLSTSKTFGAYQALVYSKGALVLRMLHFLMSNPTNGDDQAFFAMMTDFVARYRDNFASTDDFRTVANEHFARTLIAQKYKLADLNWFFNQWVYQSNLPSYQLEYQLQDQPDGSVLVSGDVVQENVPDDWFMPLPLVFSFDGNQSARGTVQAFGPKTPFTIKLPKRPKKVELDPNDWILSEKTSTKSR
ncbi:MAG: M1 family metallopeptidase [Pyrinomonadaceae bacterium]